jgi:hypothetical protein
MFRNRRDSVERSHEYERWHGAIDQRLDGQDKRGDRMEAALSHIQQDVREILKWRYMLMGASSVIALIVSAAVSLVVSFIIKKW